MLQFECLHSIEINSNSLKKKRNNPSILLIFTQLSDYPKLRMKYQITQVKAGVE